LAGFLGYVGSKRKVKSPRWQIRLFGKSYYRSRLAWFYMTGCWPEAEIDHRDLNSLNDCWGNLREATGSQNRANTTRSNTRFGLKGVCVNGNKYSAQISISGRRKYLGVFDTPDLAHAAYVNVAQKIHGEFFRAG
jgi:hypothetical protein